jgi:hypothetical protein
MAIPTRLEYDLPVIAALSDVVAESAGGCTSYSEHERNVVSEGLFVNENGAVPGYSQAVSLPYL